MYKLPILFRTVVAHDNTIPDLLKGLNQKLFWINDLKT